MRAQKGKRIILALPLALVAAVLAAGCEEYGGHHHKHSNNKVCYERVLNLDKKTGQTHYEERAVPCKR
jgi:hypothetical protein